MAVAVIQPSFSAGELAPNLYGRVDMAKYKVAAKLLRNFFVDYRGGASNRAGTKFCNFCYQPTVRPRIIGFIIGQSDAYELVFGNEVIQVYQDGAPVLQTATTISGITKANPGVVTDTAHGYSNGDEIFISGVVGMTQINGGPYLVAGVTTNTYTLTDVFGNAINTTTFTTYGSGGSAQRAVILSVPYLSTDLALIKYSQSADVMTLVHPSYPPATLTLNANGTFTYAAITVGPTMQPPTSVAGTSQSSGSFLYGYVVTAVSLDGKEESLPSAPIAVNSAILDETKNLTIQLTWTAPSTPPSIYKIYKWGPVDYHNAIVPSVWGFIGSSQDTNFCDNNIAPDFSTEPPGWGDPFSGGQFQSINLTAGGAAYATESYVPLTIVGDGTGAAGFATRDSNAYLSGVYLTNTGMNYTHATVTAVGGGGSGATFTETFSPLTPLYPAATGYLSQRRVFGGSNLKPQTVVMSQTGEYNNFNITAISQATDAIVIDIASEEANNIKSFIGVAYGMIAFTTGGAYLLSGGSPGAPITPATISATAQAAYGANDLPPIRVNYAVLYMRNKGNVVQELSFAWQRQSYVGQDISTFSNHLFFNYQIQEWSFAQEPFKLLWAVRNDGILLSMAYLQEPWASPDQQVTGWSHHDTQGKFVSVASVPEGNVWATYVAVERYLPNEGFVYYFERIDDRTTACCPLNPWFLDAALALPQTEPNNTLNTSGSTGNITFTLT